jgi:hypothetical protein
MSTMTLDSPPRHILLFDRDAGPGQAAFAQRYVTEARREGAPIFRLADAAVSAEVARRLLVPMPAAEDAEAVFAHLDPESRAPLEAKRTPFQEAMDRHYPLLHDETVTERRVMLLKEDHHGAGPGTPVYVRRSNLGTLAVIPNFLRVNRQTGAHTRLIYTSGPALARAAMAGVPAAQAQKKIHDSVHTAVSLLQMALFAVGPAGVVAATGVGILEAVFGNDQNEAPSLPTQIDEIVQRDVITGEIHDRIVDVLGALQWYNDQSVTFYNAAKLKKQFPTSIQNLKSDAEGYASPHGEIYHAIQHLEHGDTQTTLGDQPEFDILALAGYILATAAYLLYLKVNLLLSEDNTTFHSPDIGYIVTESKRYLAHIQEVVGKIEKGRDDRLAGVSQVQQGFEDYSSAGAYGSCQYPAVFFCDSKLNTPPKRTVAMTAAARAQNDLDAGPDTLVKYRQVRGASVPDGDTAFRDSVVWYCLGPMANCTDKHPTSDPKDLAAAADARQKYISDLKDDIATYYNYDDDRKAKIKEAMDHLQDIIDKYQPAAPPPGL